MESYKGNDINSLYRKLKGCGLKLPEGIRPGVDSLTSAFGTLKYVADERKIDETARQICSVLDSVRYKCLINGYNEAISTGNRYLAHICRNQLIEYRREKNQNYYSADGSSVPKQQKTVTPGVQSFPYAESLLNNTEFRPVNNFVLKQGVVNPRQTSGQWPFTSKLLDEAENEKILPTDPLLKVTISNEKIPVFDSSKCYDRTHFETGSVSDVQFRSVLPTSSVNDRGVIKHSYLKKLTGSSQVGTARVNNDGMKETNNLVITSKSYASKEENKRPLLKNLSKSLDDRRASVRSIPKKKESTPVSSRKLDRSKNKKSRNISSFANRKSDVTNLTDSCGKNKQSNKSRSKGTPRISKRDDSTAKNKSRDKSLDCATPRKRYSKLMTVADSIKVVERKRKQVSVYSSDMNSTLRPKAKRFKSVTLTPSENEKKVVLKNSNSRQCKGTVDSQVSYTNSVDFSANTTDMSSAFMETPKSTLSNRRGNVRVLYKRNLFSSPRNRAKKKWLK